MNNIKDIVKNSHILLANNDMSFLSVRLEKITMAVYMVTNLFPEEEPLKKNLRERCVSFLSFIMYLTNSSKNYDSEILYKVSEIDSLLKIALLAKLVSEMNYSIISDEYKKFLKLATEKEKQKISLPSNFFIFDSDVVENKGQLKDTKDKGQLYMSDRVKDKKDDVEVKKVKTSTNKVQKTDIKSRKDTILKFIKDKKEVSVKDILKDIKGCSEKTIQRELINFVKSGVLKKEGERRWSRYSIK